MQRPRGGLEFGVFREQKGAQLAGAEPIWRGVTGEIGDKDREIKGSEYGGLTGCGEDLTVCPEWN